jgi:hypothetical protein
MSIVTGCPTILIKTLRNPTIGSMEVVSISVRVRT